jgi:potassium-transporting ATPase KdpC subunit
MQKLITVIRAYVFFTFLLGLAYPLFIFLTGQVFFHDKANGSLLIRNNKIIGSKLIAQEFLGPTYFHSRFSAKHYDGTNSGGSNFAITNNLLHQQIESNARKVKLINELPLETKLPADMVMNSASSLDPHISIANAYLQSARIAKHRNLPKEKIKKLIDKFTDPDFIGIWGQKGVNVLQLNLELDKLTKQ